MFAIGLYVLDNDNFAISAAFSAISALIFADYGGDLRARTTAYVHLAWVGAVALTLGLLVANTTWLAVGSTLVVVALIRFVGNLGPQLHASVSPLILGFVLGVMVPGPLSAISGRVAGWIAGVAAAGILAAVIRPRRTSETLEHSAGLAAIALAELVRSATEPAADRDRARADWTRVHDELRRLRTMTLRPAGPRAQTVARRQIVEHLIRLSAIVARDLDTPSAPAGSALTNLAAADADLLATVGTVLVRRADADELARPIERLGAAREALYAEVRDRIGSGGAAEEILDEVEAGFTIRAAAVHIDAIAASAVVIRGGRVERDVDRPAAATPGVLRRVRALIAHHAGSESVWTRDAIRAGIALAVAVAIGDAFVREHAFWVALGTLSVLRSNAASTGQTAVGASVGTAIGFALSSAVFAVVGLDVGWLWVVLVLAIFAMGVLPSLVGFAAGQAAFTIAVVVLFNIVVPTGWTTGLVRLENVALGAAVSAVVALLFWPRRVATLVAQQAAAFAGATGTALIAVVQRRSVPVAPSDPDPMIDVVTAEARARAALGELAEQYRNAPELISRWVRRVGVVAHTRSTAESIERLRHRFPDGARPTALEPALVGAAESVAREVARVDASPPPTGSDALTAALRPVALDAIGQGAAEPEAVASSLFARDWLRAAAATIEDRPPADRHRPRQ